PRGRCVPSSGEAPSPAGSAQGESGRAPARALLAWCFFDWANSGFPTVISTFVFAAYFAQAVAPDPVSGQAWWGHALSIAGLVVAAASPLLGAVADKAGARKPWLALFSAACVLA